MDEAGGSPDRATRGGRDGRRLAFSMLMSVSVHVAILALLYVGAFVRVPRFFPEWLRSDPDPEHSRAESRSGIPGASGAASRGAGIPGVPTPAAIIHGLNTLGASSGSADPDVTHAKIKLPRARISVGSRLATGADPTRRDGPPEPGVTLVTLKVDPAPAPPPGATPERAPASAAALMTEATKKPEAEPARDLREAPGRIRHARGDIDSPKLAARSSQATRDERTASFRTETGGELPDSLDTGGLSVAPPRVVTSPLPEDEGFASHAPPATPDRESKAQPSPPPADNSRDLQAEAKQALEAAMAALRQAENGTGDAEEALRDAREALARAEHLVKRDGHSSDSAVDGPVGSGMGTKEGPGGSGEGNSLDLLVQERVSHVAEIVGAATARRVRRSGAARVRFNVDARGYVHGQTVVRSSGSSDLDRDIPVILHLAEPYPGPGQSYEVVVEFQAVRYAPILGE